jgi:hypothetical protein
MHRLFHESLCQGGKNNEGGEVTPQTKPRGGNDNEKAVLKQYMQPPK